MEESKKLCEIWRCEDGICRRSKPCMHQSIGFHTHTHTHKHAPMHVAHAHTHAPMHVAPTCIGFHACVKANDTSSLLCLDMSVQLTHQLRKMIILVFVLKNRLFGNLN